MLSPFFFKLVSDPLLFFFQPADLAAFKVQLGRQRRHTRVHVVGMIVGRSTQTSHTPFQSVDGFGKDSSQTDSSR